GLREGIAGVQSSEPVDDVPRPGHVRRLPVVADQLQGEVGLGGGADVGGSAGEARPAARLELLAPQVLRGLSDARLAAAAEEVHRQHVLGLEDRVPLELAAPVAVFALNGKQIPARGRDRVADFQSLCRIRGHGWIIRTTEIGYNYPMGNVPASAAASARERTEALKEVLAERVLVLDGATGT